MEETTSRGLADATTVSVNKVFDLLDRWRHFPCYQLERRADIFFAMYLPALMEELLETPLDPIVIPEFPLKKAFSNQSFKVDYCLVRADRRRVCFLEFKTDSASLNAPQHAYLKLAQESGFRAALDGLVQILGTTQGRRKYLHLCSALADLGFLRITDEGRARLAGARHRLRNGALSVPQPTDEVEAIEVVYLQPRHLSEPSLTPGVRTFSLGDAARVLRSKFSGDALAQRFAQALDEWTEDAGLAPPASHLKPSLEGAETPAAVTCTPSAPGAPHGE